MIKLKPVYFGIILFLTVYINQSFAKATRTFFVDHVRIFSLNWQEDCLFMISAGKKIQTLGAKAGILSVPYEQGSSI